MITLTTSYATPETNLYDDFDDELEEGSSIPHCQVVNPDNVTEAQMKKLGGATYGLFISQEQAELVGFTPDDRWESETLSFGTDETVEIEGHLTTTMDLVVLHRSNLEVQEKTDKGWRFAGLAYEGGLKTEIGLTAEGDRENYRRIVRYLVMFLNADGQFMHESPLQLTAKGGFGGSFGSCLRDFYKEADQAYIKESRKAGHKVKGGRLNRYAQAFLRFAAELGYQPKQADASPFAVVNSRIAVNGEAGLSKEIKMNDRVVTLTTVTLPMIMIPKSSEMGQVITGFYEEHEGFGEPNRGMNVGTESAAAGTEKHYQGVGFFSWGSMNAMDDGCISVPFTDDDGNQMLAVLGADTSPEVLDVQGSFEVEGTDDGMRLVVTKLVPPTTEVTSQEDIDFDS